MFLSLCSRGSRESLCSEILVWVHQHHDSLNWIQLSLHPISSLLPSLKSSLSRGAAEPQAPRCDSTVTSQPIHQPQSRFWGHHGHHSMSSSVAFPTWAWATSAQEWRRLSLLTELFVIAHFEWIFPGLGRVWAHLLHAGRAVQCLPGLWCT